MDQSAWNFPVGTGEATHVRDLHLPQRKAAPPGAVHVAGDSPFPPPPADKSLRFVPRHRDACCLLDGSSLIHELLNKTSTIFTCCGLRTPLKDVLCRPISPPYHGGLLSGTHVSLRRSGQTAASQKLSLPLSSMRL